MSSYTKEDVRFSDTPQEFADLSSLPTCFMSTRYQNCAKKPRRNISRHNVLQIMEHDFNKKYSFKTGSLSQLPNPQVLFKDDKWEVDELQNLKENLNTVKNKLNDYNLKNWHFHTRSTNHAGEVIPFLKKYICPEFLTQAWCKFYEIASSYHLIPPEIEANGNFNTVHLCEAPGAFITSLNHFLKINYPYITWNWLGTTLNPYYEGNQLSKMINDDRFIMHTLTNWCFGKDFTGDLHKHENLTHLLAEAEKIAPVTLVTADGSIDCQNEPGEQERIVSSLHYSEAIAALNLLSTGGSFVLKLFTIFECETICMLYFLHCLFKSINIFKPVTSKEGNSETYLVCLDYIGKESVKEYLQVIQNICSDAEIQLKALFSKSEIPEYFLEQILECSSYFTHSQIAVLERNISSYENGIDQNEKETLTCLRKCIAESFIHRYNIQPVLDPSQYIVGHEYLIGSPTLNLEKRDEDGSFSDRQLCTKLDRNSHLRHLKDTLENMKLIKWDFGANVQWLYFDSHEISIDTIKASFRYGAPVKEINSSKFCFGKLINIRKQLEQYVTVKIPTSNSSSRIEDLLPFLNPNNLVKCDVSNYPWQENVNYAQIKAFEDIHAAVKKLKVNFVLTITGLPLLSQFNVSLVFLLGQMFECVGFCDPSIMGYALIFYNLKTLECFDVFELIGKNIFKDDQSLITLLPVACLCCRDEWYRTIMCINHIMLKEMSLKIIQEALSYND